MIVAMKTIQSLQQSLQKKLPKIDWILAVIITAAAVLLHLVFLGHAGGLWRDEAGVVTLATLPTFGETWTYLGHESCPLFFPTVIHCWSAIGFGGTDFELRIYGFGVGLLLLGAIWFNGWALTRSVPLISLGLLATNITVIRWGDSLRAYGTGSVLMLLTMGFMWRFVAVPNRIRWLFALLAALASVQCMFQNAFLLLAVCVAGGAVCLRRKDVKSASAVLAIGLLAAFSMVPYLRSIHESKGWSVLSQTGFLPSLVWQNLSEALAFRTVWTKWLWFGLGLLVLFRWARILGCVEVSKDKREAPVILYATTALAAGTFMFFIYLRLAALPTQVWYYLPLMTFAAVCMDAAFADQFPRFQAGRWLLLCLVAVMPFAETFKAAQYRQTNMDLVAATVRENAGPEDLILVHPWYYGVSFHRYFTGKTPWMTLPDLADHRFHRYDLLKDKMQMENPVQPVFDKIASTLRSGHRVWIVGQLPFTKWPPPGLGPAPNKISGWLDDPYSQAWGATAGYLIVCHAEQAKDVPIPSSYVSRFEDLPVMMVMGWHDSAPLKASR